MNENLFRPQFDTLKLSDKLWLMQTLATRYNLTFKELYAFSRWGQSCTTGLFEKGGREFVFVPGDTVILGCTHYPLLLPKIKKHMPDGIATVTQGELVADSLKDYFRRHPEMDAKCTKGGNCTYYTTEAEEKFIESASTFLNEAVTVQRIEL